MPKVDMAMTEGTIATWYRHEGDQVTAGEPLFDVETDKANVEVEAPASGVLWGVQSGPGATVPIAQVIAYILAPGESAPERPTSTATPASAPQAVVAAPAPTAVEMPSAPNGKIRATPLARKIGREHQVDLARVAGSGPRGRVDSRDVHAFLAQQHAAAPEQAHAHAAHVAPTTDEQVTRVPLSGLRRVVAERMLASVRTTPHFTLQMQVDMGEASELRRRVAPAIARPAGTKLSFTAILVRALAPLLATHPYLNSSLDGETILLHHSAHIGIALDRAGDLLVPVIRDAQRLTLAEIAAALGDLSARGQARKLAPDELRGSTFTLSNLGMFGVDSFTAIINPPESAILAVGRITEMPVARDGALVIRPIMQMTLSADHRTVDGATAARFLADLRERLENPYLLL